MWYGSAITDDEVAAWKLARAKLGAYEVFCKRFSAQGVFEVGDIGFDRGSDHGIDLATVLLERGSGAAEIEAARSRHHRWYCPTHYVAKPALGSRGDGVEAAPPPDLAAAATCVQSITTAASRS